MLTWHFFIVSTPSSPCSSSSSVVSNNLSISLVSSLVINHFLQVFKTLPNFLVCCFQGCSVHDHLDKSPRARPSSDQTSPYSSNGADVGNGGWQLNAPFSCWNISYQLLWFCCLTRNLINSGVCKSSPTNLTTELPEDFRSHPFPLHNFTPFRQHLFPHVKDFAGHELILNHP